MKIIKEGIIVDYDDADIPNYYKYTKPFITTTGITNYHNNPCDTCSNNPSNGGSGICCCQYGVPTITC